MPGLCDKFRESKRFLPEDVRRYASLVEADDPKTLPEFQALIYALDKTADEVREDRRTMQKAIDLAEKVKAGRGTAADLETVGGQIIQHDQETRQIIAQRRAGVQPLHDKRAALIAANDTAIAAVQELEKLIADNADLLAAFAPPVAAKLG